MIRTPHVVVVDDEPNIGASLRLILEGEGYRVTVCETAAAFRVLRGHPGIDLYLLDVRLPDGNGIDLLKHVRQNGAFKLKGCETVKHFCSFGSDSHGNCLKPGEKARRRG